MRPSRAPAAVTTLAVLALCAFASRAALASFGLDGAAVCTATGSQVNAVGVSDGAGGMIVAWDDQRAGGAIVYVQRISPTGASLWGADGLLLANGGAAPAICSDGAGGAIVAWGQGAGRNVFAQRLLPSGAAAWTAGGVQLTTMPTGVTARYPTVCSDGAGGAFVAWQDLRDDSPDVYAQHLNSSGTRLWATNGVPVCVTIGNSHTAPVIVSGQSGTAVVAWLDDRNGNQDLFAQRVSDPSGAPSWTSNGVVLCNAAGTQSDLRLLADGAGAYAAWTDERAGAGSYNAYMQRLAAANGASLWAANGIVVTATGSGIKLRPSLIGSGSGILVAWQDHRNGFADIYAQRFDNAGAAQWAGDTRMTDLANHQDFPVAIPDGADGAFVAYADFRADNSRFGMMGHVNSAGALVWPMNGVFTNVTAGTSPTAIHAVVADGAGGAFAMLEATGPGAADLYVQRIAASGNLADYDATIGAAGDLPADEGGYVRLTLGGAIGDAAPGTPPVVGYNVWRRIAPAALARAGRDELPESSADARARGLAALEAARSGEARLDPLAAQSVGFPSGTWESLGMTGARGQSSYFLAAPTRADSGAAGPADESFVVTTQTTTPAVYSVSNTVVAHSVDNLAPAAPQNLAGQKTAPSTLTLSWNANHEADLAGYAVYRGTTSGFTPSLANRIATPAVPGLVDGAFTALYYYKVSALDRHGNESGFALLDLSSQVGVEGGALARELFLGPAAPNPAHSGADFDWGLPHAEPVSLAIYDVRGRLVRTLAEGEQSAGTHHARWDGRDRAGSAATAGAYFARLVTSEGVRTRQVVVR